MYSRPYPFRSYGRTNRKCPNKRIINRSPWIADDYIRYLDFIEISETTRLNDLVRRISHLATNCRFDFAGFQIGTLVAIGGVAQWQRQAT